MTGNKPERNHGHQIDDGVKAQQQAADKFKFESEGKCEEQRCSYEADFDWISKGTTQFLFADFAVDGGDDAHAHPEADSHWNYPEVMGKWVQRPRGNEVGPNPIG